MVCRKTELTASEPPATARASPASDQRHPQHHRRRDRRHTVSSTAPKPATANPNTTIEPTMTRPWWTTRTSPPENRPASTAPAAKVALSTPVVKAPPPRKSTPTAGNSTLGIAMIMAIRSTTKVIRTLGRVAR